MSERRKTIQAAEARQGLFQIIQQLLWGRLERVDITYRGKPAAVLCSWEYLDRLAGLKPPQTECESTKNGQKRE